ncbi:MAG TPA: S8 family serine peptidase [Edaphocola sp.]|nr:S8 family serine peptidase [Edaphocola sp.]
MKHILWVSALLLLSGQMTFAQQTEYAFRIYFKDKNATSFSLDQPESFLSQRAIQRRWKFNIPIDSSDLPVCKSYADSVLSITSGHWHCQSKWQNTVVIFLTDTFKIQLLDSLAFFKAAKLIAIYPNGLPKATRDSSPGTANKITGFDENYYAAAWNQISFCNGQYLHQHGQTGTGTFIAVIDAGFYGIDNSFVFDSLLASGRLVDRWNFVEDTLVGNQEGGHGTEVLSCIAGNLPNTFVGTAPGASIAIYTSEDLNSEQPIEEDNWTAAAERADSLGADMITTSLGYNTFDAPFPDETFSHFDGHTTYIAQAANQATTKGILVVASAGNEGSTSWHNILTPGDADSALTVGAVNNQNAAAAFSGWGPNAANMIKPDVVAMGVNNAVVNLAGNIQNSSGTSVATPIIAGLAACLMQTDSLASPADLRALIRSVSDLYTHPDSQKGYGLPDFAQAFQKLTGIHQEFSSAGQLKFDVYPNPVIQHQVHISFAQKYSYPLKIRLCNVAGKAVFDRFENNNSSESYDIHLPSLPPGNYLMTIQRGLLKGHTQLLIP